MPLTHKPIILLILDGWGHTDNTVYNAIHAADKPHWDRLSAEYPHTLISASGLDVGLPPGQMGNSEVGHMNMGAGRVLDQEFTRITRAIESGAFFQNETLARAFTRAAEDGRAVHIMGLLSPGGVHSHEDHIFALIELARQCRVEKLYLHAFLDGRDTLPKSALESIHKARQQMKAAGIGRFASLIGRYYAMDRDRRWPRTRLAYDLITAGRAEHRFSDPFIAVEQAYARGETDEFIKPTVIGAPGDSGGPGVTVADGDVMVFANYRADRARQLARAMTKPGFGAFTRARWPRLGAFISLTSYKADYDFPVAFPAARPDNVFGEYIAALGLKQLRIAETEKYAHVTFFFNGGKEVPLPGEDRILVPSPQVATYDLKPEMSVFEVTERLLGAINRRRYDAIICNFANADMVGHTGDFEATVAAVEAIDQCLGRILKGVRRVGGELMITADHGNAEQLRAYTTEKVKAQAHTAHTSNPVPLIYAGRPAEFLPGAGALCDIAPTLLHIMGLPKPAEMTGRSLLRVSSRALPGVVGK